MPQAIILLPAWPPPHDCQTCPKAKELMCLAALRPERLVTKSRVPCAKESNFISTPSGNRVNRCLPPARLLPMSRLRLNEASRVRDAYPWKKASCGSRTRLTLGPDSIANRSPRLFGCDCRVSHPHREPCPATFVVSDSPCDHVESGILFEGEGNRQAIGMASQRDQDTALRS